MIAPRFPLAFACASALAAATSAVSAAEEAIINVGTQPVSEAPFLGFGVQWSPYPWCDPTDEDWERVFRRLDFMRVPLARVMTRSYKYCQGFDAAGKPVYDWNNSRMRKLYRLLDYCESRKVTVILGEWDDPASDEDRQDAAADKLQGFNIEETDPRWSVIIGDLLDHLVKERKYTCIRYFNLINEPNGGWSACADFGRWKTGIQNLHAEMKKRGHDKSIQLIGPDVTWQKDFYWLDMAVQQLPRELGAYDLHEYAPFGDVESGWLEKLFHTKKVYVCKFDGSGKRKPFIMGEVGMGNRGPVEPHGGEDSHPKIQDHVYGVWMTDYIVQCARAGMDGAIAWMLDDAMHIMKDKQSAWPDLQKVLWKKWGFFNSMAEEIGHPEDAALRPWYVSWSLMSLCFPPGSKVVQSGYPWRAGLRALAARTPDGGTSYVLVNDSDQALDLRLVDRNAPAGRAWNRFHYFPEDHPVDAQGYPVAKASGESPDLAAGVPVALPARGVWFLTTVSLPARR